MNKNLTIPVYCFMTYARRGVCVLAVFLALAFGSVYAQTTNTFTGPVGGLWGAATNWSLGTVPTSSNDVLINMGGRVNIYSNATAGAVTLSNNNTEMVLAGTSLTANNLNLAGNSGNNVRIFMDSGTLSLGGGTGSLTTSGGVTSWLTINYGTSVLNLASANLSYLWMASGPKAQAQLTIPPPQGYPDSLILPFAEGFRLG